MTDEAANQHPHPRWWLRLLLLFVSAVVLFLIITAVQVARTASLQEIHAADAIVVFGAAEYSGRPSPVLRARLKEDFRWPDLRGASVLLLGAGGAARAAALQL